MNTANKSHRATPSRLPHDDRTRVTLAVQLLQASAFVGHVRQGRSSKEALGLTAPEHAASTQAIGFTCLRQLARADFLLKQLVPRPPASAVENLLLVALSLMCHHSEDPPSPTFYDAHTVVNQSVEAAKRHPSTRYAGGLVNACLRRFLRERAHWLNLALSDPQARWNLPDWWLRELANDYPACWQEMATALHAKAPLVLRVAPELALNTPDNPILSSTRVVPAHRVGKFAWALEETRSVQDLDGFSQGQLSVQDAAAQLAAPLLLNAVISSDCARRTPSPTTLKILDACAAPGGKTTHLLELARHWKTPVRVTALDIDAKRGARIQENLQRCQLEATVLTGDAGTPDTWWDGNQFEGILLDAPCSASGIVRRHPDVPWLRRASDLDQLCEIQARLLDQLWPLLAPGGHLLYCTCSQFKKEGAHQIAAFLSRNSQACLRPSPGHLLAGLDTTESLLPDNRENHSCSGTGSGIPEWTVRAHDGFYYALLQKLDTQKLPLA